MNPAVSLTGIIASVVIGAAILAAGSTESLSVYNLPLFALCGAIGFILHWAIFIPSYLFKTEHYFDLTGSISFITTVIIALILTPLLDLRDIVIGAMVAIWALRLGSFLFWRVKKQGKDNRFNVMKTQFLWFLMTWTLQGLWVFLTSAAALAAITTKQPEEFGLFGVAGLIIWVIGFSIEVVADEQKRRFRNEVNEQGHQVNRGTFIRTGLWKYSRHPNYFGEITLWFGMYIISLSSFSGLEYLTIISPIFVYILLTRMSGINMLEKIADQRYGHLEDYLEYKEKTPLLVPYKFFIK